MNPFLIIGIPLVLMAIGMMLNSLQISFDQPESSREPELAKQLAAERQSYRVLFDSQRRGSLKRQKRFGQYAWLVLAAFVASSWWLYVDTVNKTTALKQITAIQTLPVVESKDVVLSLTLSDGNNIQYLIKLPTLTFARSDGTATEYIKSRKGAASGNAAQHGPSQEAVQNWRLTDLGTALSTGNANMPLGIALNISK